MDSGVIVRRLGGTVVSVAFHYYPGNPVRVSEGGRCGPGLFAAAGLIVYRRRNVTAVSAIIPLCIDSRSGVKCSPKLRYLCVACNDKICRSLCLYEWRRNGGDATHDALKERLENEVVRLLASRHPLIEAFESMGVNAFALPDNWLEPHYLNPERATPESLVAEWPEINFNTRHLRTRVEVRDAVIRFKRGMI